VTRRPDGLAIARQATATIFLVAVVLGCGGDHDGLSSRPVARRSAALGSCAARTKIPTPPESFGHGLVYDHARGVDLMFAGGVLYELDAAGQAQWSRIEANGPAPSARFDAGFAFDRTSGKAVLFGGSDASGLPRDLWEWDGCSWTDRTPSPLPPNWPSGRWASAMTYDWATGHVIVTTGFQVAYDDLHAAWESSAADATVFEWDSSAGTFTARSPAGAPPTRRGGAVAVADQNSKLVYLFDGVQQAESYDAPNNWDTKVYVWDGGAGAWSQRGPSPAPSARAFAAGYQEANGQIVVTGGLWYGWERRPDNWRYDPTSNTFSSTSGVAFNRAWSPAVFDEGISKAIQFGGLAAGPFDNSNFGTFGITAFPNGYFTEGLRSDSGSASLATLGDTRARQSDSSTLLFEGDVAQTLGAFSSNPVTVDGVLSPGEWDDAAVRAFSVCGDAIPGLIYVKNDLTDLYVAIVVDDASWRSGSPQIGGTGSRPPIPQPGGGGGTGTRPPASPPPPSGGGGTGSRPPAGSGPVSAFLDLYFGGQTFQVGDNSWVVRGSDGLTIDGFYPGGTSPADSDDVAAGGTKDVVAAVTHTNPIADQLGTYTVEFKGTLDSTDDSHDFSLHAADVTGLTFALDTGDCATDYYWPPATSPMRASIQIESPPNPAPDGGETGVDGGVDGAPEEGGTTKALGDPCAPDDGCPAPYLCVDGVCCENDCGGGNVNDCQACSTNAGGQTNGMCTPVSPTTSCLAPGECAALEFCDGTSRDCPGSAFLQDTPCPGATLDTCEASKVCTGFSPDCTTTFVPANPATKCAESSTDPCLAPSFCTGSDGTCPALQPVPPESCGQVSNPGPVTLSQGSTTITLTFNGTITQPGRVGVVYSDVGSLQAPERFRLMDSTNGAGHYWDIRTDAQFTGSVTVCVAYDASLMGNDQDPSNLKLEHWDKSGMSDFSGQTGANPICVTVTSLSPFALIAPLKSSLPVVTTPAAVPAEASGPAGAVVSYAVAATDPVDGPLAPSCVPASGSTFPIGTTMVTCKATDLAGIFAVASFPVVVNDTQGPIWSNVPADMTVFAATTAGAKVTYTAPTAIDEVDGKCSVSCTLASGSTFALGSNTVKCTATDQHGHASSASFGVWVQYQAPTDGTFFKQPINPDGSSIFKAGSTIPVKFQLTGASAGVSNAVAHLLVARVSNGIEGTYLEATTNGAADTGNLFRSDGPGSYIYNLSTKGMATGTWSLRADLGDGVAHSIVVSLK
jgi:hypothetical protein